MAGNTKPLKLLSLPMNTPSEKSAVVGSQRARQGQNVKGMRKVLIWGTLLTAIGFGVLLALFGGMEPRDADPNVDLRVETNPAATAPTPPPVPESRN
jgi:hypothetical protein